MAGRVARSVLLNCLGNCCCFPEAGSGAGRMAMSVSCGAASRGPRNSSTASIISSHSPSMPRHSGVRARYSQLADKAEECGCARFGVGNIPREVLK